MTKVLILGAAGSLARVTTQYFIENTDAELKLYLRNANRLKKSISQRVSLIEGDVLNKYELINALQDIDVVYANLSGDLKSQAQSIISAMNTVGIRRLIFISSMGIYDEVPGEQYGSILDPYRDSAALIEKSDLDYTIIRPGWFTNDNIINYVITHKGEPFKGRFVSRLSIADFICKIATTDSPFIREIIGIAQA
ncbi:TPA: NAD-dependent dehydratase [Escherichia coli]|uniref:NAD(P)H-binding protein n=1 Tax=Escherichia coli TaxID=562 RepID=UPI00157DBF25|nr:NAD(P)H-binding protein [Escherichia coli]EEV6841944.1 NAD-dependent dehydratase [Escherichia coli]EFH5757330.1 NAD(P)H-binding protein [Escherichia coli]EHU0062210.1 NAD(P)H-binding protein [Escherichia coli]MCI5246440.1 NAD-dependent dehydratase [Escherichia coli]HAH3058373.1 NAD-dependent dehydratase [Escherichia coli]